MGSKAPETQEQHYAKIIAGIRWRRFWRSAWPTIIVSLVAMVICFGISKAHGATTQPSVAVGINADPISYYAPYCVRNNIAVNAGGNSSILDNGTTAYLWGSLITDRTPGNYTVSFSGTGSITVQGITVNAGQSAVIPLTASTVDTITVNGSVSGLTILPVGVADGWNPNFVSMTKFASWYRTMQLQRINYSTETTWASRVQPGSWSWAYGVPHESLISLANTTGKDLWVCVPAGATSDYITGMANLYSQSLSPPSHLYIEFSNETWNSQFPQYQAVLTLARANKKITATDVGTLTADETAEMDYQVGVKFQAAFVAAGKQANQVRPVLATQSANPWLAATGLQYLKANYGGVAPIYAVAIAPYIDDDPNGTGVDNGNLTAMQIFSYLTSNGLPFANSCTVAQVTQAKTFGLPVITYEGGCEVYGQNAADSATKTAIQTQAPMGAIYQTYFQNLISAGVVGVGHYEFEGDAQWTCGTGLMDRTSPKIAALLQYSSTTVPPPATQPTTTPTTIPSTNPTTIPSAPTLTTIEVWGDYSNGTRRQLSTTQP